MEINYTIVFEYRKSRKAKSRKSHASGINQFRPNRILIGVISAKSIRGQPDRRPFLSTLEPSPTPRRTGNELSAVDSRPIHLFQIPYISHYSNESKAKTLSPLRQSPFSPSLGDRVCRTVAGVKGDDG